MMVCLHHDPPRCMEMDIYGESMSEACSCLYLDQHGFAMRILYYSCTSGVFSPSASLRGYTRHDISFVDVLKFTGDTAPRTLAREWPSLPHCKKNSDGVGNTPNEVCRGCLYTEHFCVVCTPKLAVAARTLTSCAINIE